MTSNLDFDDDGPDAEVVAVEEEPARRTSPLRLILLVLLILILLCCGGSFALRSFGNNILSSLPFSLPGIGAPDVEVPIDVPVVVDTATPVPGEVATAEVPLAGETLEVVPVTPEIESPLAEETEAVVVPPEETVEFPLAETPGSVAGGALEPGEEDLVDEHAEEPGALATLPVSPGEGPTPTSTPVLLAVTETPMAGPTVVVTLDSCQANNPPVAQANGPYNAMLGKGQAFVTLDAAGSSDSDGTIIKYEWDFGDGSAVGTGQSVTHGYTSTGTYTVTLTVTDNCGETSQSTAEVAIVGPTPPAMSDGTATN